MKEKDFSSFYQAYNFKDQTTHREKGKHTNSFADLSTRMIFDLNDVNDLE